MSEQTEKCSVPLVVEVFVATDPNFGCVIGGYVNSPTSKKDIGEFLYESLAGGLRVERRYGAIRLGHNCGKSSRA